MTGVQSIQPDIDGPYAMNVTNLRRRANAVFLACEEGPASDLSAALKWSADRIEELEAFIIKIARDEAALKSRVEQHERTIDLLESNARVQAKLLADTGRRAEELDKLLAEAADFLNRASRLDAMDLGAKITAYRLAQQKSVAPSLEQGGTHD